MLAKVKKIFSADIIKVSSLNAVSTLIKMLTSFISMKVVALLPNGPVAVALLGQLNNFTIILQNISNGGINNGITKYVAEYTDSEKKYVIFLRTGFWITAVLSVICGVVLISGAGYFSILILKNPEYTGIFYILGATIVLYALNALLISIINGFREFRKYVIANISGSLVGLVFTIVLSFSFGVYGALISAVTYQSVVFIITLFIVSKSKWFNWKIITGKISKLAAGKLGHYSLMALVSALAIPIGQLIVRNYISVNFSLSDAGLWEGVNRISAMYLLVITSSLSVYYLPKLTELKTKEDIRNEVFAVYKLMIPFLFIASVVIFSLRSFIIEILFSPEFANMKHFFAFQLLGDTLKMSGWVLGFILIAKSMTRTFVIMEIVSFSAVTGLSILFTKVYGSWGATVGYAAGHLTYLVIMLFLFRKTLFLKHYNNK